jgi:hypothetical protein
VPAGLAELSGSLASFADFLRIDQDLLNAAAQKSLPFHLGRPTREDVLSWVHALPAGNKDGLLLRLVMGEEAHLGTEMLNQFLKENRKNTSLSLKHQGRAVRELIQAGDEYREQRRKVAVKKATEEKARCEAEKAALREKQLNIVANREAETWLRVDQLIATKQPSRYDEAMRLLIDLRDVAARKGKIKEFMTQITFLRNQHEKKSSFLKRLGKAGL